MGTMALPLFSMYVPLLVFGTNFECVDYLLAREYKFLTIMSEHSDLI